MDWRYMLIRKIAPDRSELHRWYNGTFIIVSHSIIGYTAAVTKIFMLAAGHR